MDREITYLMSGAAHMPYLVTSLYTLRDHYDGKVVVHAYPNCFEIAEQIGADVGLNIEVKLWKPEYEKKNSQFITKILMVQEPTCDVRLYLDADTTIHGPLDELFEKAAHHGMCITQFNEWMTTGGIIRARVERLKRFPKINQTAIDKVLRTPHVSPNGGIFAVRPESRVLRTWYDWSWEAISIFICDEAVLHILPEIYGEDELYVMCGGKYNCSHRYGKDIKDPHVYHYHGNSCVRPTKCQKAVDTWMALYRQCIEDNVGNVEDWRGQIRNRHMIELEEDPRYADLV